MARGNSGNREQLPCLLRKAFKKTGFDAAGPKLSLHGPGNPDGCHFCPDKFFDWGYIPETGGRHMLDRLYNLTGQRPAGIYP